MAAHAGINYEKVADIVREEIRAGYVPNACILAARMTTLALREFGVEAEAMACTLDVLSPAYVRLVDYAQQLGHELTAEEMAPFVADGAWRVELNFGPVTPGMVNRRGSGYNGHVVALAEERTWLLDPTLEQVNRPKKGLIVEPPYAYPISSEEREITMRATNGTLLRYVLIPGRKDFARAPDWIPREPRRKALFDRTLGRIIDRVEKEALDVVHHR